MRRPSSRRSAEGRIAGRPAWTSLPRSPSPRIILSCTTWRTKVVVTPHIGGATTDAIINHTGMILADIKRYFAGEPMLYAYKG